jgi:hypothetical protein
LIERRSTPRTDSAPSAADWPGLAHRSAVRIGRFPLRRIGSGLARRLAAWLGQIRPGSVFLEIYFKFDLICELLKFIEYSLYEKID